MSQEWSAQPELAAEVTRFYELALDTYRRNPLLLREHVGHEESIRTGGYSTRTLQELIQNAADATRSAAGGGRIEVVLAEDTLYCANNGAPFTAAGLRALTHAFLSEKRGDEIGRFGLGFKSTLAVTNAPQIFSRSISFGFGGHQAQNDLRAIAGADGPVPVLRTAAVIDIDVERLADPVLNELTEWATTVVRLPGIKREDLSQIKLQMQEFDPEFLLFAEDVAELTLNFGSNLDRKLTKDTDADGFVEIFDGESSSGKWIVAHADHTPSKIAQGQVGKAVARDSVKITVAIPEKQSSKKVGEFWAYFPLADEHTTASGIFNAPWSLNDDRTTLLENDYNRELLVALASLFAQSVLRFSTPSDPARHFDYLTARGKEARGFGDRLLTQHIPTSAAKLASVPDATGRLCLPSELRPLSFAVLADEPKTLGSEEILNLWQLASSTGNDVPHFRCYSNDFRKLRLRRIFAEAQIHQHGKSSLEALTEAQMLPYLLQIPSRALSEWLKEWASGTTVDAADAFRVATDLKAGSSAQIVKALPLIPTTAGKASLDQATTVFLEEVEGIHFEGAQFVLPEFLRESGIRARLEQHGIRSLTAATILLARFQQLPEEPKSQDWEAIWDAMLDLNPQEVIKVLSKSGRKLKVPTLDGGWAWPARVFDVSHYLGPKLESRRLDRQRCISQVAHQIGVTRSIKENFKFKHEPCGEEYGQWVLSHLEARKHPDQPPIENIEYSTEPEVGPVSVLVLLERNDAPDQVRAEWTEALLNQPFDSTCAVDNCDTGESYTVPSYQSWALSESGIAHSSLGLVPVRDLLHPKLFLMSSVFPVSRTEPRSIDLPASVEEIPEHLLLGFLKNPRGANSLNDSLFSELLTAALSVQPTPPPQLPARVGKIVETLPPSTITITQSDEERAFAHERVQPYIHAHSEDQLALLEKAGAIPFTRGFSISIETSGQGPEVPLLELFTGLRGQGLEQQLRGVRLLRVETLSKLVETPSGVTPESHAAILDGTLFYVRSDLDDVQVLSWVNELLGLGLTSIELQQAQKATLTNQLQQAQSSCRSASTDAARLNHLFGDRDLEAALPEGLWDSLLADESVGPDTDVAALLLQVWGFDTLKVLKPKFERLGFSDVPLTWTGSSKTVDWVRKFGFDERFAGEATQSLENMFVVPGAVDLQPMHEHQVKISRDLASILTLRTHDGKARKAMVELPTGAGKTRVAAETALTLLRDGALSGTILWIAQSQELCEQAVETFKDLWRGLQSPEALTIGRLWDRHEVTRPQTKISVVIAVDAKIEKILKERPEEYEWLSEACAVFVDEGHRAGESSRYTKIFAWLGVDGRSWDRPLVGLTATAFRGRSEEGTRSLVNRFGKEKLSMPEEDPHQTLVERGILARLKHEILDGANVQLDANTPETDIPGQLSSKVLEAVASDKDRMSRIIAHIMSLDPNWPVLVFTPTVLSAQGLAARLKIRGVTADSISGETGTHERRRIIERFKSGETRVLANCGLLTAGFDAPQVRALYVAKPTLSPNAYIQMVGRGLRGPKNGGKEECLIVDLRDNFDGLGGGSLAYTEFDYLWEERR